MMKNAKLNIIKTAIDLINQNGVKETSIRDICKAANISTGTFTYYYPSRDDMLEDVFDYYLNKQNQLLKEAFVIGTTEKKETSMPILLNLFEKYIDLVRLNYYLLGEALSSGGQLKQKLQEKYQYWRERLVVLLFGEKPDYSKQERMVTLSMMAWIDGIGIQILLDPDHVPMEMVSDFVMAVLTGEWDIDLADLNK